MNVSGNEETSSRAKNIDDVKASSNGTSDNHRGHDRGHDRGQDRGHHDDRDNRGGDRQRAGAMEVTVEHNNNKSIELFANQSSACSSQASGTQTPK